jgi:hypothetical protein
MVCGITTENLSCAAIFGNHFEVPKVSGNQVPYAAATASTGFWAISLPTRSDNCAPLLVQ